MPAFTKHSWRKSSHSFFFFCVIKLSALLYEFDQLWESKKRWVSDQTWIAVDNMKSNRVVLGSAEERMSLALSEMLRGQLELTSSFLESQKRLYATYCASLNAVSSIQPPPQQQRRKKEVSPLFSPWSYWRIGIKVVTLYRTANTTKLDIVSSFLQWLPLEKLVSKSHVGSIHGSSWTEVSLASGQLKIFIAVCI